MPQPGAGHRPAQRDEGHPPDHQRPRRGLVVLGVLLVVLGVLWLLDTAGAAELRWRTVLPAVLLVIGVALLVGARHQDNGGLVAAGIVVGLLVLAQVPDVVVSPLAGIGERDERPASAADLQSEYALAIGSLTLDLRDVDLADGPDLRVRVGIGEVTVWLPDDVTARARGRAGVGEVRIDGRGRGGIGARAEETLGTGPPDVDIDMSIGVGRIEVRR